VLHDVDDSASSFVGAFGTFASDAVRLRSGRNVFAWIDPPPRDWRLAGLRRPGANQCHVAFGGDRGRVFRVPRWPDRAATPAGYLTTRRSRRRGAELTW